LAAEILKVGESRIWMDPEKLDDIKNAITRADIKKLISQGTIKATPGKMKKHREKEKRRKGPGRKKGRKKGSDKRKWIATIRSLRRMLKELRDSEKITKSQYRQLYPLVKGGMFRSRSHLMFYLKQKKILKED
jgi:large subunit ribosomal protein L19e